MYARNPISQYVHIVPELAELNSCLLNTYVRLCIEVGSSRTPSEIERNSHVSDSGEIETGEIRV